MREYPPQNSFLPAPIKPRPLGLQCLLSCLISLTFQFSDLLNERSWTNVAWVSTRNETRIHVDMEYHFYNNSGSYDLVNAPLVNPPGSSNCINKTWQKPGGELTSEAQCTVILTLQMEQRKIEWKPRVSAWNRPFGCFHIVMKYTPKNDGFCDGKSRNRKWMMTGGIPMTKRKPPFGEHLEISHVPPDVAFHWPAVAWLPRLPILNGLMKSWWFCTDRMGSHGIFRWIILWNSGLVNWFFGQVWGSCNLSVEYISEKCFRSRTSKYDLRLSGQTGNGASSQWRWPEWLDLWLDLRFSWPKKLFTTRFGKRTARCMRFPWQLLGRSPRGVNTMWSRGMGVDISFQIAAAKMCSNALKKSEIWVHPIPSSSGVFSITTIKP